MDHRFPPFLVSSADLRLNSKRASRKEEPCVQHVKSLGNEMEVLGHDQNARDDVSPNIKGLDVEVYRGPCSTDGSQLESQLEHYGRSQRR